MITQQDVQALLDLLQRTPMSAPERLYASDLLGRLNQLAQPTEVAPPAQLTAEPKRRRRSKKTEESPPTPEPLRPPPLSGY